MSQMPNNLPPLMAPSFPQPPHSRFKSGCACGCGTSLLILFLLLCFALAQKDVASVNRVVISGPDSAIGNDCDKGVVIMGEAQYIIPALAAVVVAVIEAIASKERKENKAIQEKTELRAQLRAEESHLSMHMMNAAISLGVATALAIEEKKLNGEMRAAKAEAEEAQRTYHAFCERIAAKEISK